LANCFLGAILTQKLDPHCIARGFIFTQYQGNRAPLLSAFLICDLKLPPPQWHSNLILAQSLRRFSASTSACAQHCPLPPDTDLRLGRHYRGQRPTRQAAALVFQFPWQSQHRAGLAAELFHQAVVATTGTDCTLSTQIAGDPFKTVLL